MVLLGRGFVFIGRRLEGERKHKEPTESLHYWLQPGALQSVILLSEFYPVQLPGLLLPM
jgi:hypothetical protein